MVSGAEAIILPIAASHWCGSVRDRAAGSSPGSTTAVPACHRPSALTRTPGFSLQVADVAGLHPVGGDQPEGIAI